MWSGWIVESRSSQRMTIHEPTNQSDRVYTYRYPSTLHLFSCRQLSSKELELELSPVPCVRVVG